MNERRQVLALLEAGKIDVNEAVRRLEALAQAASEAAQLVTGSGAAGSVDDPLAAQPRPALRLKRWWWLGPAAALVFFISGGIWLWRTQSQGWGLLCGVGLVVLALALAGLGVWLARALWLVIDVVEETSSLHLEFPLPLGGIYWGARLARRWVPALQGVPPEALREVLRALRAGPVMIAVQDEGQDVRLYLG